MEIDMEFVLSSYIARVGYNPEMADMSNPRGEIYAERWVVWAEKPCGRRWQHERSFAGQHEAQRLLDRIEAAHRGGRRLNLDHWVEIDPAYGSDAYVSQGIEGQRAAEERREAGLAY
jgi:hypothetical protein